MTYELKHDDVVRVLKELAAERPYYVYEPEVDEEGEEQYLYCHKDGPGCIVGHVVAKLLPEFPLGNLDIEPGLYGDSGTAVHRAFPRQGVELQPQTLTLLRRAQAAQDERKTWGDAVAAAFVAGDDE